MANLNLMRVFVIFAMTAAVGYPSLSAPVVNVDATLTTIPLYSAIKKYYPKIYVHMVRDAQEKLNKGVDVQAAMASLRPHLDHLVSQRLPYASNDAAVTFMKSPMRIVQETRGHQSRRSFDGGQ